MDDAGTEMNPFGRLGDETRLRIVLELGDAGSPGRFDTLEFSELQSRVGVRDNGTFNYHLGRLVGSLVERTDDGYRLALPGVYVYRALRSAELTDAEERRPTALDCTDCGTNLEAWVDGGRAMLGCPACDVVDTRYPLPAGTRDHADGQALYVALQQRIRHDVGAMLRGFCPYCSGRVTVEVGAGEEDLPNPDDVQAVASRFACENCGWHASTNLVEVVFAHPRTVAFLLERDLDPYRVEPTRRTEFEVGVARTDPWYLTARVDYAGDSLHLEFDGDLRVTDWRVERGD